MILDCEWLPHSVCCNEPILLKITDKNIIYLLCASSNCENKELSEIIIGETEVSSQNFIKMLNEQDKITRKLISRYVISGKFRSTNLSKKVNCLKEKYEESFHNIRENNEDHDLDKTNKKFENLT